MQATSSQALIKRYSLLQLWGILYPFREVLRRTFKLQTYSQGWEWRVY